MIRINRARFSHIVWENIFQSAEPYLQRDKDKLQQTIIDNEKWRRHAEYNTGSMSLDAMYTLYAVASFFKPDVIAEVGTFIGNSASAMIMARPMVELHTCDYSNSVLIFEDRLKIKQYRKKSSTDMFKAMVEVKKQVDLFFIDGRLSPGDMPLIRDLKKDTTVFALDDFEGIEKGVANAGMLFMADDFRLYYHMVYPPKNMNCNVALLVPRKLVEWTDQ